MLLDLSNELIALILDLLESQDLLTARLTSRRIYLASLPTVATRFFTTITTNLSKTSINTLQGLLDHGIYCNAVREIHFAAKGDTFKYGVGLRWPRDASGLLQWQAEDAVTVQNTLAGFPGCTSYSMERDGSNDKAPSYGTSDTYLATGDVMTLVLSTLSISQQPIRHVSFALTGVLSRHSLVSVPPGSYALKGGFWHLWSKLKTLRLGLSLDRDGRDAQAAADLVSRATDLQRLELCDDAYGDGAAPLIGCMVEASRFPSLTHLRLRCVSGMSASALIALLERTQGSLTNLRLDLVSLDGSWKDVCIALKRGFPKLRCLTLLYLHQINAGMDNTRRLTAFFCPLVRMIAESTTDEFSVVSFTDPVTKRGGCAGGVRYRGANMHSALEHIVEAIYLGGEPVPGPWEWEPVPDRLRTRQFKALEEEDWIF